MYRCMYMYIPSFFLRGNKAWGNLATLCRTLFWGVRDYIQGMLHAQLMPTTEQHPHPLILTWPMVERTSSCLSDHTAG